MSKIGLLTSYGLKDASKSRVILVLIITSLSIAFAAVLASASVLEGFRAILIKGAVGTTGHLIAVAPAHGETILNAEELLAKIRDLDEVEAASLHSLSTIVLNYDDGDDVRTTATEFARGIIPADEMPVTTFSDGITEGNFFSNRAVKEVVLGQQVADNLVGQMYDRKVPTIGDEVEILTFEGKREMYTVAGITDAKSFLGNLFVLFDKNELEQLDDGKINSEISIKIKNPDKLDEVKKQIENLNWPINVETWRDRSGYIEDILSVVTFITLLINRLLIVSVFVIISIIVFISVFQKRRQIGIMKSMGAGNAFIVGIFMFETFVYSVLAYAIGFGIYMLIYAYSVAHPSPTTIGDFALVLDKESIINTSIILLIATIAGSFLPSYIAAKTRIVEVLQGSV